MSEVRRVEDRRQADILADRKRRRTEILKKLRRGERMNNEVNVKITLLPGAELPKYARPGDSGFDLVAQEDYVVEPGATVKVRTGIALEIPEGYEVQIRPRSGISERTKLRVANSPGTGDSSYRGEICVLIDNIAQLRYFLSIGSVQKATTYLTLDGGEQVTESVEVFAYSYGSTDHYERMPREVPAGTYIIRKGDRIAQAVICPVYRANFEVVAELSETERGAGGFGHSGITSEVEA